MKLAIVCAVAVAACDPQVDGSFAGDPRVRVQGAVTGFTATDVIDGGAISWNTQVGADLRGGPMTQAQAIGIAPAGIELDVFELPDADQGFAMADGATVAEGRMLLTSSGSRIGEAINYALVFVDHDAVEDSLAAAYVGGKVSRGFHLCVVVPTVNVPPAQQPFVAACGGTSECASQRRYRLELADRDLGADVEFFKTGPM